MPGRFSHGKDYFANFGVYNFDDTKLVVEIDKLKINGFEVFRILKEEYHIQSELSETYSILFLFALGSKHEPLAHLKVIHRNVFWFS